MSAIRSLLARLCLFRSAVEGFTAAGQVESARAVLSIALGVALAGVSLRSFLRGNIHPLDVLVLTALTLAWLSTRTRYYQWGAGILILVMCAAAYQGALVHLRNGERDVTAWLVWLGLPLWLTPLLFPARTAHWVALLPPGFLLLFVLREQPVNWSALWVVLSLGSLLSTVVAHRHERDILLLTRQREQLEHAYEETLQAWAKILEARDQETFGHSKRVVALTLQLAQAMGIHDPVRLALHTLWLSTA